MKQYFLDSCAIAKLYCNEVGSHRVQEIFNEKANHIFYSEIAYTETISVLCRMKNAGHISEMEYEAFIARFRHDFISTEEPNIFPVDISDVIVKSHNYILTAYKLKNEVDRSLSYIQSLDTLQLGSWLHSMELNMRPAFVTADNKLAKVASCYKDHLGIEVDVINLNSCGCHECAEIKQRSERSA